MDSRIVLGVSAQATKEDIRTAYKALALKWHPDRHPENQELATSKFVEINKAHRTLLRELRRAQRATSSPSESTASLHSQCPRQSRSQSSFDSQPHSSSSTGSSTSSTSPTSSCPSDKSHTSSKKSRHGRHASTASTSSDKDNPSHSSHRSSPSSAPRDIPTSDKTESKPTPPKPARTRLRKQSKPASRRPDCGDFVPKPSSRRRTSENTRSGDVTVHELSGYDSPLASCFTRTSKEWSYTLKLTLEDLRRGKRFRFRFVRHLLSGKRKSVILDVDVPLGCQEGTKILFCNVGHERTDGTRQDIAFVIKEMDHERFSRVNNDLVMKVRLPWVESLSQDKGKVCFKGIDGEQLKFIINYAKDKELTGTHCFPSAGMPLRDGSGRGILTVHWEIVFSPPSKWEALKQVLKFHG